MAFGIHHKIVITGVVSLAAIYITLIICNHDTEFMGAIIVGIIGICTGIIIPNPKIDNRRGVLKW